MLEKSLVIDAIFVFGISLCFLLMGSLNPQEIGIPIYFNSGITILSILIFAELGAIGIFSGCFINCFLFPEKGLWMWFELSVISIVSAYLVVYFFHHFFKLDYMLRSLTSRLIILLMILFPVFFELMLFFFLDSSDYLSLRLFPPIEVFDLFQLNQLVTNIVGALLGCITTLYFLKSCLSLSKRIWR